MHPVENILFSYRITYRSGETLARITWQTQVQYYVLVKLNLLAYQMVESSQVMNYDELDVPEARFSYDLSPMAVVFEKKGKRWYEFLTSIAALIGGTFTVVGLISSFLGVLLKAGKKA